MADQVWIKCPCCDYGSYKGFNLRRHCSTQHPDLHPFDLERHITQTFNPDLDIDLLIYVYLDHKETIFTLARKGVYVQSFLTFIGICRTYKAEKALMNRMRRNQKYNVKEYEKTVWAANKSFTHIKKQGIDDPQLYDVILAMKVIKYAKQLLEEARNPPEEKPKDEEYVLIGRYTERQAAKAAAEAKPIEPIDSSVPPV